MKNRNEGGVSPFLLVFVHFESGCFLGLRGVYIAGMYMEKKFPFFGSLLRLQLHIRKVALQTTMEIIPPLLALARNPRPFCFELFMSWSNTHISFYFPHIVTTVVTKRKWLGKNRPPSAESPRCPVSDPTRTKLIESHWPANSASWKATLPPGRPAPWSS